MFPQPPCSPNQSYFLDSGLDEGMRTEVASREGSSAFIKAHTDGACVLRRLGSWHCEKVPMAVLEGNQGTPAFEGSQDAWAIRLKVREPQLSSSPCHYLG